MFNLALAYEKGEGTKKNSKQYFQWTKKAADADIPNAMFNLALAYIDGEGTKKNLKQYFQWMKKAADADIPDAMFNLALAYEKGEGTKKNPKQYFQWMKKAAEAGIPYAMFNLALTYKKGDGTEKDLKQYFQWTKKAADADIPYAMFNLALAYEKGDGTGKDLKQYFQWMKKAAETDIPDAMFHLALAYIEGEGTKRDLNQYFYWIENAYKAKESLAFIAFPIALLLKRKTLDKSQHNKILNALHDLRQKCKDILKKHCIDDRVQICHYTKFSALAGILQKDNSNHLRLYNVAYFNDPLEGMSLLDTFGDMCEFFYEDKDKIPHEIEAGGKFFSVYVCAFTMKKDHLDMWRAYGNNGDGYSITSTIPAYMKADEEHGIMGEIHRELPSSAKDIQEPSPGSDAPKDDDKISIYKVLYGRAAKETFESLKEPLEKLKGILNGIGNKKVSQITKALATQILADLRYLYKHEAYKSEKEYRIIRVIDAGSEKLEHEEISQTSPQPPRFYIKTPLFLFQERGCKITIGPRVTEKAAAEIYIKQQLHKNRWHENTEVVHSKMPYR